MSDRIYTQAEVDLLLAGKASVGVAGEPAGSVLWVQKDPATGFWPASYDANGAAVYSGGSASAGVRPTSRADVMVIWKGPDPSPAIVSSGTGGLLNTVDERHITP